MSPKKLLAIMALALIALANAAYLTYHAYELRLASTPGFCDISDRFSCSNVLASPASEFFGYPFPAVSMVVYPIIFLVALLGYLGYFRKPFHVLAGIGLFGTCFNAYYIYQEAFNIGSFCPLCLMCWGIIIAVFWLSVSELMKK